MAKKKRPVLPYWAYDDYSGGNFAMVSENLLSSKKFCKLSNGAQIVYLRIMAWKQTQMEHQACFNALREYAIEEGREVNEVDLHLESSQMQTPYFVLTEGQMKRYGAPKSIRRGLKELIENGFIRVYKEKPKHVTVYQLSPEWKKAER